MSGRLMVLRVSGAVLLMFLISSCVASYDPKGDYKNQEQYLADNFSKASLPAEVDKTHRQAKIFENKYKKMSVSYKGIFEKNGQTPIESDIKVTNFDAGDGYCHQVRESSTNTIPSFVSYNINYMDFLRYRWQGIRLVGKGYKTVYDIKELLKFNPIPENPVSGKTYEFEYTWGAVNQARVLGTSLIKYTVGDRLKADTIFSGLKGDAVILEGQRIEKDKIVERNKIVFLVHYGLIVQQEVSTAYAKMKYEIRALEIF